MSWKVHLETLIMGRPGFRMYVLREDRARTFSVMLPPTLRDLDRGCAVP